jgi:hypothetical protein
MHAGVVSVQFKPGKAEEAVRIYQDSVVPELRQMFEASLAEYHRRARRFGARDGPCAPGGRPPPVAPSPDWQA